MWIALVFAALCGAEEIAPSAPIATPAPVVLDERFNRLVNKRRVPRGALERVTRELIAVRLERASILATQDRWVEAMSELLGARRRIQRARGAGAVAVSEVEVEARIARVKADGSAFQIDAATLAHQRGDLAEALARVEQAKSLDPALDTSTLRGTIHEAWADREVAAGDVFATARQLTFAATAVPGSAVAQRADTLNQAIGTRLLDKGACRAATEHLAKIKTPTETIRAALAQARTCAVTSVRVSATDDTPAASLALGDQVVRATRSALVSSATSYLEVGTAAVRRVPGELEPIDRGPVSVTVSVRRVDVTSGTPERVVRSSRVGAAWYPGDMVDVIASWEEYREPLTVNVVAQVQWVDGTTGEVRQLRVTGRGVDAAVFNGHVLGYTYQGAFRQTVTGVSWGNSGVAMATKQAAEARIDARKRATQAGIESLADNVAQAILTDIDNEAKIDGAQLAVPQPW